MPATRFYNSRIVQEDADGGYCTVSKWNGSIRKQVVTDKVVEAQAEVQQLARVETDQRDNQRQIKAHEGGLLSGAMCVGAWEYQAARSMMTTEPTAPLVVSRRGLVPTTRPRRNACLSGLHILLQGSKAYLTGGMILCC